MGKNHNANGKCLLQSHHFTSNFKPSTTRTLIKENQIVGNIICRNLFTAKETKEYLPEKHIPEINPNRSLEIFLCKKSDYSRLCHRYSICMLTQYADFALFQDKMKANFSNDRFRIKKKSGIWNEYKTECKLLLWPNIQ